jgi:membrane-bound metal-dependent hydrolase YbcI (DUF457 family)
MDIATHAMAGTVIALPFLPTAPWSATCFIFGSVLPDTDALSRVFGKMAFLRWHQTYTHSLPIILLTTAFLWLGLRGMGVDEVYAPLAFGAGMMLHVFMDATNTYGVALLAPFSRRRFCTEWLFFIDGTVGAVSITCFAAVLIASKDGRPDWVVRISLGYDGFLVLYWLFRCFLYRRAVQVLPRGVRGVVPSAMVPWHFFGYALSEEKAQLFNLDAISGAIQDLGSRPVLDLEYEKLLKEIAEYRLMKELSPGYTVVDAQEQDGKTRLDCQDLRIRNFGGKFGRLELFFDANGKLERKEFHV